MFRNIVQYLRSVARAFRQGEDLGRTQADEWLNRHGF
jgi:hypothetical protein